MFQLGTGIEQGRDDVHLAHADRRRQRRGTTGRRVLRIGATRQQQIGHCQMATTGRTQQRGAALCIDGVDGESQIDQAAHGVHLTGHRGGR
ncbi:hypothetical protein G6F46_015595 [Rhizopus delemar]|nr:hypothetical protein G6F46_015595 [Rhizopus delemar]